ncbi:uncharacterized protein LOC130675072 [Microplitis mediator]|uniref:uncharacterized protein LOC130675072 n=1 Tax=Microplitis mediator TaxID=375433 RepID=UPI002557370B|nr:uncharacterized protein LOC130675072 [Microplitis mediator]
MYSTQCPAEPCDGPKPEDNKNKPSKENERLDRLEKEVGILRTDVDKIKWEQAVAEAAIGRAIIRGSASLGCFGFLLPQQQESLQGNKNLMIEDPRNVLNQKFKTNQQNNITSGHDKYKSCDPCPENKKNIKDDDFFTFG